MLTPSEAILTYILAKDRNRPFMMTQAFSKNVELEMIVKTDAISFPSSARGLTAVQDILVRRFNVDNENIYTFCLSKPGPDSSDFSCQWLVGMSVKTSGQLRVGCGRYDWRFNHEGKVERLTISIDIMKVSAGTELDVVMNWLSSLPYPWCSPREALASFPEHAGLSEVKDRLRQVQ